MNLREEMLEAAGLKRPRASILRLVTEGSFFNRNLGNDLRVAVEEGVITSSDAHIIKMKVTSESVVDKFFDEYARAVDLILEKRIDDIEDNIEGCTLIEESETLNEEIEDLRSKREIIRNILC